MSAQTKKFRSKFFRVAVEGATTDGRVIERTWIEQMASSYDPKTYAARVWIEHMRSMLPDSPFRAYGDVTALKAEEVEVGGEKKLALFAQIEPTKDLVAIVNTLKQKLFTSIEVAEKFAATGKAYFVGLAVTDSPASLGTEMLAFASQNPDASPLKARKQAADNLFTAAAEASIELEEVSAAPPPVSALAKMFAAIGFAPAQPAVPEPPAPQDVSAFGAQLLEHFTLQEQATADLSERLNKSDAAFTKLSGEVSDLVKRLGETAAPFNQRPVVAGPTGDDATDC